MLLFCVEFSPIVLAVGVVDRDHVLSSMSLRDCDSHDLADLGGTSTWRGSPSVIHPQRINYFSLSPPIASILHRVLSAVTNHQLYQNHERRFGTEGRKFVSNALEHAAVIRLMITERSRQQVIAAYYSRSGPVSTLRDGILVKRGGDLCKQSIAAVSQT